MYFRMKRLISMNELQKKVFTLLKEVDECCRANDISYYLHAETALHAYKTGELHPQAPYAKLAIFASSVDTFLKALDERRQEDRTIEHWGNNKNYPSFSIRYSDKNSLCYGITTHEAYKCNGVYLLITIIRREEDAKLAKMRLERGIRFNSGIFYRRLHPKRLLLKYGVRALMCLGGKKNFLQRYFLRNTRVSSERSLLYRVNTRLLPYLFFEGPANYIELWGRQFQTFNHPESYFLHYFGQLWSEKEFFTLSSDLIVDATISEESYKSALSNHRWTSRKFFSYRRIVNLIRCHRLNKKVRMQQVVTSDIVNVIYLKELYLPRKAEIMKLYSEKDFDSLREELAYYIVLIEKQGKVLKFDADLFEIAMRILKKEKGEIYTNRITSTARRYNLPT